MRISKVIATSGAILFSLCLSASFARAAITLPLQGYCRMGRYFPVCVDGADAATAHTFSADGCLTTQMQAGTGVRIIPILATGFPISLSITSGPPILLRTPGENEKLVASTGSDISAAGKFFPGQKLLPIRLDLADPLPGNPAVWETLDAVVLDTSTWQRVNDAQRSALLAGGVVLIATGAEPPEMSPDVRWPWQHRNGLWVLSISPAGPAGEAVNADLYAPTEGWTPGWSSRIRAQVLGVGALLVLVIVALTLRPNRWTLTLALLFAIAAAVGIALWRRSLGIISLAGGDVLIDHSRMLQRDAWVYERAAEDTSAATPTDIAWTGSTHPIFPSDTSLQQMQIVASADGKVSFAWAASAGHTMAFVRREISPGTISPPMASPQSPMLDAVKSAYLAQGDKIMGQVDAPSGRWPTVVVKRESHSGD